MQLVVPQVHRWTRAEYATLAQHGLFARQRVELLDGLVLDLPATSPRVAATLAQATAVLSRSWPDTAHVRARLPLVFSEHTELVPDMAIVDGPPRAYLQQHPERALLIVEVGEGAFSYLRGAKASTYARAGIVDYWIINLVDNQLEIYRDPAADPERQLEYRYRSRTVLQAGDVVTPLMQPQTTIAVVDLLP